MDQEKTYKWIQDRLRDLQSGTLSDADRLRLEELAKTDPFIADALEGYQSHAEHDHSVLLKVVAQRIQNKNVERRPKLLPLSRGLVLQAIAASFVIILATWAVIYYVQIQNDPSLVAVETVDSSSTDHSTEVEMTYPDSSNSEVAASSGISDEFDDEPSGLRANAQAKYEAKTDASAERLRYPKEAKAKENLSEPVISAPATTTLASDEDKNEVPTTYEDATETLAAGSVANKSTQQKDDGYYANQMDPSLMSKRISGQVVDFTTGESLIGVQLSIPNTNIITTSDLDGRFELDLPEPSCIIQVNYTGYLEALLKVSQGEEDVVITLGSGEKIPTDFIITTPSVDSKEFLNNFFKYLQSNSQLPIQKNYDQKAKEVKVEFTVSEDGQPRNINKIKSTAEQKYMVEAYRLIMEGPSWLCNNYRCGKEYTFYFK